MQHKEVAAKPAEAKKAAAAVREQEEMNLEAILEPRRSSNGLCAISAAAQTSAVHKKSKLNVLLEARSSSKYGNSKQ